jgi:hypothetical protein
MECMLNTMYWLPYVWEGVLVPMVEEARCAPWTFWTYMEKSKSLVSTDVQNSDHLACNDSLHRPCSNWCVFEIFNYTFFS